MKHIHIVDPYHSAAMQRVTYPLLNELPKLYTITSSAEVDNEADLNIHFPMAYDGWTGTQGEKYYHVYPLQSARCASIIGRLRTR